MSSARSGSRPLIALFLLLFVFLVLIMGTAFLAPAATLAQVDSPDAAKSADAPQGPPAPLPLASPIQTPEPGQAPAAPAGSAASADVEVIPFRPKFRLQRGQLAGLSPSGAKPAGAEAPAQKPADGVKGPEGAYQAPDFSSLLSPQAWNLLLYEDFEGAFPGLPGTWIIEDFGNDGFDRSWGDTSYYHQVGNWSAWPAAGGADALNPYVDWYSDNLNSWMEYELDFSGLTDVFVSFGLWYDTEPSFDWAYFCVSTDFSTYSCDYWSGYSGGWTDESYWLTSYAGYSQVWLAWVFSSDASISAGYEGPFVDEVVVWGDSGGAPTPTPTPDPGGQLISNGSFETGDLTDWSSSSTVASQAAHRPSLAPGADLADTGPDPSAASSPSSVGVVNTSYVEGTYAANLSRPGGVGEDYLYQVFSVPAGTTDLVLDFWQAVTTFETAAGFDFFCTSLMTPDLGTILVDLGCTDAVDAIGTWQQVVYTLDSAELSLVVGQSVAIVFELYNDGAAGSGTAGWVDYVNVFAIGGSGGGYSDANEPNNTSGDATAITCGAPISGTIGESAGSYDIDWFRVNNVPTGRMDIDIAARTKIPPSALDSVVNLYDSSLNPVAYNDDDDVSYDSYIVYTNTVPNATYYVTVESYSGSGSLDSFYDLHVNCAVSGTGTPTGGNEAAPPANTWTVMLYLNAEDPGFVSILNQYRTEIEAFIASKSSFLKVVILYDGPNNGDTVRYLVQPNGAYTDGVNRWPRGELNMGHPDTLANFVTWAIDQYPAENYYLAIDDHGDGAYGISLDRTSNNDLLIAPDVYAALKSATHNGDPNRKIDIFDYEACLMGLVENAYDVREWVNHVVFFEQISWGLDTYPSYFNDLAASDTAVDVGTRIIQRYHDMANAAGGRGLPHTISLIDTSQLNNVMQAVSNLGNGIMATNTQAQKDAANAGRNNSQAFANDSDATNAGRAEYIDLWDLANSLSTLAPTQVTALKNAVDAAVIFEKHASGGVDGFVWNHNRAHGLSIYYPTSKASNAYAGYGTHYQMSQNGTWDAFLEWVLPTTARRGMFIARAEDKLLNANAFTYKYIYVPFVTRR